MYVNEFGRIIVDKCEHSKKQLSPIDVNEFGRMIDVKFEHLEKQ
jgi:hypothetical protein